VISQPRFQSIFLFFLISLSAVTLAQNEQKPRPIVATFEGRIFSDSGSDPVLTTFTIEGGDRLNGTYVIENENGVEAGNLSGFKWEGAYTVSGVWRDKKGSGHVRILFSADFRSFRGYWGDAADTTSFPWDGVRKD
jgi:hypothetical protein